MQIVETKSCDVVRDLLPELMPALLLVSFWVFCCFNCLILVIHRPTTAQKVRFARQLFFAWWPFTMPSARSWTPIWNH